MGKLINNHINYIVMLKLALLSFRQKKMQNEMSLPQKFRQHVNHVELRTI